jgi:hypothetical protein
VIYAESGQICGAICGIAKLATVNINYVGYAPHKTDIPAQVAFFRFFHSVFVQKTYVMMKKEKRGVSQIVKNGFSYEVQ